MPPIASRCGSMPKRRTTRGITSSHHVGVPVAFGAVVPVAVVAAGGEGDDRRRGAVQARQAAEDGVVEGALGAAAAVQEDEQRALAPRPGFGRHDHVDAEVPADRLAVDLELGRARPVAVDRGEHGRGQDEVGAEAPSTAAKMTAADPPTPPDLLARGLRGALNGASAVALGSPRCERGLDQRRRLRAGRRREARRRRRSATSPAAPATS